MTLSGQETTGQGSEALRPGGESGNLWPSRDQLLLLHASLGEGAEAVEAYRSWRRGVDLDDDFGWDILRLLPLAYHNLHRLGFDEPLMGRMKGMYRRYWVENHTLFHQVSPILRALTDRGMDVLLLKGMPLVLDYYENHALRPMADVDVVVPFHQARNAVDCMAGCGWSFLRPLSDDMLRYHHALQCFGPGGMQLDLHWHVTYEACTSDADRRFWARSEPLNFQGLSLTQLDPTALLLHTVVHGVRWNREPPVRWIPDALTVLRKRGREVDWSGLVDLALEIQAPVRLRLGLGFLRDEFGGAIPRWVMDALPSSPVSLRERIDNALLLKAASVHEGSVLRWQWALFSEFCRRYWAKGPVDFVSGYSHFLRFHWGLNGRREMVPFVLRGLWKRITGRKGHTHPIRGDTDLGAA